MSKRIKRKKLLIEAFFATVLVFVVMWLVSLLPYNIKALNPVKEIAKDFRYSDVYYSKIKADKAAVDTSIVLINIGSAGRYEIAQLLDAIDKQAPAVIGVDAFFPSREDTANSALASAFRRQKDKVVAGMYLQETEEDKLTMYASDPAFGLQNVGYLNLVGEDSLKTTIRYFRPYLVNGKEEYLSWGGQIVKAYSPERFEELRERGGKTEIINYTGDHDKFVHLEMDELVNNPANQKLLQNKIVLLGFMGEYTGDKSSLEDLHFTPLNEEHLGRSNPDMYGLVIQANIISMILRGDYINEMPVLLELLLSFIICYAHVVLFAYFFVKNHLWYHPVAKVAQFITAAVLLYIMLLLYAHANYSINTTMLILGVILSVDVLYLYDALAAYLYKRKNIKSVFTQPH